MSFSTLSYGSSVSQNDQAFILLTFSSVMFSCCVELDAACAPLLFPAISGQYGDQVGVQAAGVATLNHFSLPRTDSDCLLLPNHVFFIQSPPQINDETPTVCQTVIIRFAAFVPLR